MRREDYSVTVDRVGWVEEEATPELPRLTVEYGGEADRMREQLVDVGGNPLSAADLDVSFRLQGDPEATDTTGVLAVAGRLTGEFILEANAGAESMLRFVRAARRFGETTTESPSLYTLVIRTPAAEIERYRKRTFLVYNESGDLLRERSLIPGGVEL